MTQTQTTTAPSNPVSRGTLIRKATAKAQPPKAEASSARPKAAPIVRHVPAGYRLTPETVVTTNVDIQSVKVPNNKNWTRAADYPQPGQPGKAVKDLGRVTRGDVLYDWCRGWCELSPEPVKPAKQ